MEQSSYYLSTHTFFCLAEDSSDSNVSAILLTLMRKELPTKTAACGKPLTLPNVDAPEAKLKIGAHCWVHAGGSRCQRPRGQCT